MPSGPLYSYHGSLHLSIKECLIFFLCYLHFILRRNTHLSYQNSAAPDQMPRISDSDLGLQCLPTFHLLDAGQKKSTETHIKVSPQENICGMTLMPCNMTVLIEIHIKVGLHDNI